MSATLQKVKRAERKARDAITEKNRALEAERAAKEELARLLGQINSPHTENFLEAVRLEAMHQRERWGVDHDEGKAPSDWFWLLGWLAGKALAAAVKSDTEKAKHHTISSAAVLLNWHAAITGESNRMRPGTGEEARRS